ncbi:Gamma-tubulin complex component GCP4 [Trichuris trichiura]|uniref:Gamma-tubulin complex component GCP4 n=1 Tax=Trichuris trichiura TaxID=36087 RepID=A0A077ZEN9_TRITR|nr:Gamma-tubulin complex component GCP4 [Trichuris trichiura]
MDKSSPFGSFLADSKFVVRSENSNMTIAHVVRIESGESSISFSLWETHISIGAEKVNLSVSPTQQIIVFILTKPRLFIQRDGCSYNFSSPFSNLSMQPTLEENGNLSGIKIVVTSYRWDFSGQCDSNYFNVTNSSTTMIIVTLTAAVAHSFPKFLSLVKHPDTESAFLVSSAAGLSLEAELRDSTITMEQNSLQLVHTQVPSKLNIQTEKYQLLGSGDDFVASMSKSELLLHYRNSQIRMSPSAFLTASFVNARMIISALNSSRTHTTHLWSESLPNAEMDVLFSFLNLTIEPAFTQIIISTFNSSTVINRQSPSIKIMSNYSTMKLNSTIHVIHIFTGDWLQIMSSPKLTCKSDGVCAEAISAAQRNMEISFNITQSPTLETMEFLQVSDEDPVTLKVETDEAVSSANLLTDDVSAGESLFEASVPALAPLDGNITVEGMYGLQQAGSLDSELFPVKPTESSTSMYLTDAEHIAIESEIIKIQVRLKYEMNG